MVDLKLNRRESGLCNKDLAHLLNISSSRVARLQTGNALLSVPEAIVLSVIYGKNIDQLLTKTTTMIATLIKRRLADIPCEPDNWTAHDKRLDTLNALAGRLQTFTMPAYEY